MGQNSTLGLFRASIAFGLLVVLAIPATGFAQSVGITSAVKQSAQTRKAKATTLQTAKLKQAVGIGDYIKTGQGGVLQITLRDRTKFTVGRNAESTIDRFVYDPAKNASEVSLSVAKGAFRFVSGAPTRNRKSRSSVKTPVGSIGIRGTVFDGAVGAQAFNIARNEAIDRSAVSAFHPDATLVHLIADAIDLNTPTGVYPLERPGDAYFVPKRGAEPIGPFQLSASGSRILRDLIDMAPDPGDTSTAGASAYPQTRRSEPSGPIFFPGQTDPGVGDEPGEFGGDLVEDPARILDGAGAFEPRDPGVDQGPIGANNPVERAPDTANQQGAAGQQDQPDRPPPQNYRF